MKKNIISYLLYVVVLFLHSMFGNDGNVVFFLLAAWAVGYLKDSFDFKTE